ncbi:MAG: ABC transporter substrate-binding protein [Thauera sp.]|jgi:NitT/TauT family transport system substrate-binding protein|nr:ABC transporter substrate-binding protein [Thauera sp.]
MTERSQGPDAGHICLSSRCDCGISRRDWLRMTAIGGAAAAFLLRAGDLMAQHNKGDDQPVRIGYLPITDAAPLLVAHSQQLFEAEGLRTEKPRLFRSWAQIIEAFIAGQVNVVHLLSPTTLFVRYGSQFGAKVVAWNHTNGSALAVAPHIDRIEQLAGQQVAIPFWYSIHNVVLQQMLRAKGLKPVSHARNSAVAADEVNLIVMPPAEMVSALASKAIAGYIVAEPFVAAAELAGVGKVLRFVGDVWQNHACCLLTLAERDVVERPAWAQRVTNAVVKSQLWLRENPLAAAQLLASNAAGRYTPHGVPVLAKVLESAEMAQYEQAGVIAHPQWQQRRIDFQPYPYPSYTVELVKALRNTRVEGNTAFLDALDPEFVARDLVDDRFVKEALQQVGGLSAFGLAEDFSRQEVIAS